MKWRLLFGFWVMIVSAHAQRTPLLPRADGAVDIKEAAAIMKPGDTIELQGDYLRVRIENIQGTKDSPIIFINKGLVTVGGYKPYTVVLKGRHFKVLGNGDSAYRYGIVLGKAADSVYGAFGFGLGNSSNVEIAYCEMNYLSCGILQNPPVGDTMQDCYYHDNYIHDLNNPKEKGRSEGFYLGNSKGNTVLFDSCRIENNVLENLSGDGIQVAGGTFLIKNNIIKKWGQAQLAQQRAGILVGGWATANVLQNRLDSGMGVALQVFGRGSMQVQENVFSNMDVSMLEKEDIIYINGKTADSMQPLSIDFSKNVFENLMPNRRIIFNGTHPSKLKAIQYFNNRGLEKQQAQLSILDNWIEDDTGMH